MIILSNFSRRVVASLCVLIFLTHYVHAQSVTLDMVIPVGGVAHEADGGFTLPMTIMGTPLSTDQDLSNMLDNNPSTFYQPAAGSNGSSIGSDVLLDFTFPPIPDNAVIESVTLRVGISSDTTDGQFLRGFFFSAYSRLDTSRYMNTDLGTGVVGGFLVSPQTPVFGFPPLVVVQVPRGTTFEMNLAPEELTLDNVRNLSVVVGGLNEAPLLFDRTTLVNATVVYSVPELVLNPVFPALDDNINSITAENATAEGNVAFIWGMSTGSTVLGGRICNGLELGIKNPNLLAVERANEFGAATHIFYIPLLGDFELLIQLQAIDIESCSVSNVVPQIIRKDESG